MAMATIPYRAMSLPAAPLQEQRPLREVALGVINAFFLFWILSPVLMLATAHGHGSFFGLSILFSAVLGTPPALAVAGIVLRGKRRRRALLLPSAVLWLLAGSVMLITACSLPFSYGTTFPFVVSFFFLGVAALTVRAYVMLLT
jgi:hypothetical protein